MLRYKLLLFVAAVPLIGARPLLASAVQVGTCKPNLKSYATISAAVSSVTSGATVYVCPGTYPEQVTITQPINLTGVAAGTANQILITVPSGGLVANTTSMFGESVAAQVNVEGAGPVNITNITVDGTGGNLGCLSNTWSAGIYYGSASSGTVNRVRASNQVNGACGVGIWAENADGSNQSVTIQNSTVFNTDGGGIFAGSGTTPTLSVLLNNNIVNGSSQSTGIVASNVNGQARGNEVINAVVGIFDEAPALNLQGNTILGSGYGIFLVNGGMAVGNRVSGSNIGVLLGGGVSTVTGNRIESSLGPAVEMSCLSATLSQNFINDASVGIDQVPSSGMGPNTLANTATTTTSGCGSPALAAHVLGAKLRAQWHTPATPFGTRTN